MADIHKRKKKRGRSKLFKSCFRSFANDERPFLNNNNNSDSQSRLGEEDDVGVQDVNYERSSSNRSVPRLLKAVLFEPVMVKKMFSSSKSSTTSYTNNTIRKQLNDSNASCIESTDIEDSSSSRCSTLLSSSSRATSSLYSSSSSSSSLSSTNSTSRWLSEPKTLTSTDTANFNHQMSSNSSLPKPNLINSSSQTDSITLPRSSSTLSHNKALSQLDSIDSKTSVLSNPDKLKNNGNNWSTTRLCLFLLLSFIVLVVYGRIYAILCTSIWFYMVPGRRVKRVNSVINSSKVIDTESEQYKKRVIMAGLLDRTRNPLR
ncbi:hypothetical protein M8C21_007565 [Ambrosia artemisiifolia]|uniref:Uncharacterized protein n=1 Tax=Ambrosia artemisiifolia TaxID=4212 RepID=A0AAD5GQM5_AMBAR|nr:hypothetical protein M8C21_007565 [Ambrosia artemisiifolia]